MLFLLRPPTKSSYCVILMHAQYVIIFLIEVLKTALFCKKLLQIKYNIICPITCLSPFIWDHSLRLLLDRIENGL